jgi:acetyl esterase
MTVLRFLAVFLTVCLTSWAQAPAKEKAGKLRAPAMTKETVRQEKKLYKTTPQGELYLHISYPADWKASDKRPAAVFFFGGGWKSGSYTQFSSLCDYLASRGMVAASADYRILSIHKTLPDKCVEDARSAVRWLRSHAAELGIDTGRIVAGGGSAGGHLAACTATVDTLDAADEDKSISAKPNALVLFNPALHIGTLFKERGGQDSRFTLAQAEAITPNNFLSATTPPAILFFGTADALKTGADAYMEKASALKLRAELWLAADQPHGFFNRSPWTEVTARKADEFLTSLGYLSGEPTVKLPAGAPELQR